MATGLNVIELRSSYLKSQRKVTFRDNAVIMISLKIKRNTTTEDRGSPYLPLRAVEVLLVLCMGRRFSNFIDAKVYKPLLSVKRERASL